MRNPTGSQTVVEQRLSRKVGQDFGSLFSLTHFSFGHLLSQNYSLSTVNCTLIYRVNLKVFLPIKIQLLA